MSNEELAAEIRSGRKELVSVLWEQVQKFIAWKAGRYFDNLVGNRGIDIDDLIQGSYFALLDAVEGYDPEGGAKFLTYLSYHLHRYFTETAGLRTDRTARDPINDATSLDLPIGEDQDGTLADLYADSADQVAEAEEQLFQEQLHDVLEKALADLEPADAEIIRQRYFKDKTYREIAEEKGVSLERIRQREARALRQLRNRRHWNELESYIEIRTPFFLHTNFERSGSPVESIVELRERLEREFMEKQERKKNAAVWRRHKMDFNTKPY